MMNSRRRKHRAVESLERRVLLAGDLVGHWRADDLNISYDDQAVVSSWSDAVQGIESDASGQPILIKESLGGRSVVRFETSDGIDGLNIGAATSPMCNIDDFSIVVAFVTSSTDLQGNEDQWFKNSGLVDSNNLGLGKDWGVTINSAGKISAGLGAGFISPPESIYSDLSGLNDGELHIATLTRSQSDLMLYVGNSLAASTGNADASTRSPIDMSIGRTSSGDFGFDGDIAEVRIYNGQLDAAEVNDIYGQLTSYYNNARPIAVADQYTVGEDATILEAFFNANDGVLANDVDPEGDPLTAVAVDEAEHGKLTLNADGSFFYDSDPDFFGQDSFTYVARDFRDSEPVTVTIDVLPKYDAAAAHADGYKLLSGNTLSISLAEGLLANDDNPDQAQLKAVVDRDVAQGDLTLSEDGSFTYDPQGFAGQASFSYRIDDGTQLSDPAEVTIIVNSPPVANDDRYELDEDVSLVVAVDGGVAANDVDAESDPLTATVVSEPAHGTLTLGEDGSFRYEPAGNFFGDDSFTYKLTDGEDESSVATVQLVVRSVNDAPNAAEDVYFGLADKVLTVNALGGVLANDTDMEGQALTAELASAADHGTVQLAADGSFSYEAPAEFTGVATFTYRATDGQDSSSPVSVQIAINSLDQQQQVVINEVHIDPPQKTELVEFIELHNQGDAPIDLSGWTIRDAVDFTFPAGATVEAGGYLVVTMDPAEFQDKFQQTALGPWGGRLTNSGETIELWTASGSQVDEVDYQLGFPWPTVGEEPGPSMQLVHPSLQNDLGGSWRSAAPTPGRANSVLSENAAPQMRRVSHSPEQPKGGDAVTITTLVTDPHGVQSVNLEYQLVNPGDYIGLSDNRYDEGWTTVAMRDDGLNGDQTADDGIYSVVLPAELQAHRRLVRYRVSSTDALGASITAPYEDDPQPNFAYFVYSGVPDWTGSDRPGREPEVTYSSELLESIPVYHLITTRENHVDSQFIPDSSMRSGDTRSDYRWEGTMVYDGVVYDHVNFRARGGVWRYAMGKNMWKFDFSRGHSFQARDDYGNEYDTKWDKLNFSSLIQQGNFRHRGEQGLFESTGFKLFNLAGTEAPNTNYVHFRIVESADENGADQYGGDFQGLYLAIEQPDGRFLDEHDLPDGNFYKIEGNNPESVANQGPYQVDDRSDARDFIRAFRSARPEVEWWRENLDLEKYYGYQAISHAIHHYDTAFGKNFYYYNNPETGVWEIHPWDLDLTWANNMYGNENHEFNVRVAKNGDFNDYVLQENIDLRSRFNKDYQNRTREILDLLYNPEQTGMLIDEMSAFVYQPGEQSFVDADRAMWDYNPIIAERSRYTNSDKNGERWRYYDEAATKDYPGMIKILKDYIDDRTRFINRSILRNEDNIPTTPSATYEGEANFPVNDLRFSASAFASPISAEFASLEWRIAEITDPSDPSFDPYNRTEPRKYEIQSLWESGETDEFSVQVPAHLLEIGATYRVRVRMKDNDGHWSHWSDPVQFVTSAGVSTDLAGSLRVSEVNYNPAVPSAAELAAGYDSNDDFEFIELVNIGSQTLDLTGASLVRVQTNDGEEGVDFHFADGQVTSLSPGQRVLVVEDLAAFQARYGDQLPVAGQWSGRLSNDTEMITVSAYGTVIQQFQYADDWHPTTDGDGPTLEFIDPTLADLNQWNDAAAWRASATNGGTPGNSTGRVPGDSSGDGSFDSSDLVLVFQAGKYEDGIPDNASYEEGDWNVDGDFDSSDLVFAFQAGTYVLAARPDPIEQVVDQIFDELTEREVGDEETNDLLLVDDLL